jgi:chromate reductase, NAD(P)H dehydrogenase (quinone)
VSAEIAPHRTPDPVGTSLVGMSKQQPHVVLISGSMRARSVNAATLRTVAAMVAPEVRTTLFTALDSLPYFSPDIADDDLLAAVRDLRSLLSTADAVVFSTPEYAGAMPGALKNLLEWTVGGIEFSDMPVGWINPSAGGASATYASLSIVLGYVNARVIPEACVRSPLSHGAVGDDGLIASPTFRTDLQPLVSMLRLLAEEPAT